MHETERYGEIAGNHVRLIPVSTDHLPELRRIRRTPEVAARWGLTPEAADWPLDDPETIPFAVVADRVVGMIQYSEEMDPAYRHASIDIFLDPDRHGRGIGRDAVWALARHLIEQRGHHRLVIDPAHDNQAAIRCYSAVGFKPVGAMRRYERDADGGAWHDGLLMDLLAGELTQPG